MIQYVLSLEHHLITSYFALLGKSKAASSELISVHLTKSFCLSVIMYARFLWVEALSPSQTNLRMLDNLVYCAILVSSKIFNIGAALCGTSGSSGE